MMDKFTIEFIVLNYYFNLSSKKAEKVLIFLYLNFIKFSREQKLPTI